MKRFPQTPSKVFNQHPYVLWLYYLHCSKLLIKRDGTIVKLMTEPTKRGRPKSPHKISQASKAASVAEDQIQEVFNYWKASCSKPRSILDDKRRLCIGAAIHDYGLEQCKNAIEGCTLSDFHMGRNKSNKKYNDVELILRDARHIEQFLDMFDSTGKAPW